MKTRAMLAWLHCALMVAAMPAPKRTPFANWHAKTAVNVLMNEFSQYEPSAFCATLSAWSVSSQL